MKAIVAVDNKWGIGKNNDLLFSIKEDMQFFRATTLNKVVVMGGNTLRSFPNGNPLKNRINIVLSTTLNRDGCIVKNSLDELKAELKKYNPDDIYIIGGARFYSLMLDYCDEALVTKVNADGGAEVFFPNLDSLDNWTLSSEGEKLDASGYEIRFTTYKNNAVKEL